jgi:hypothetical protein
VLEANEEDFNPDIDEEEDSKFSGSFKRQTYTSKGFKKGSTLEAKNKGGSIIDRLAGRAEEEKGGHHDDDLQNMLNSKYLLFQTQI